MIKLVFLHAAQVFIRNTTELRFESIQSTIKSIHCGESIQPGESIQLPLPFIPSSFTYTHPFELGVGPLGS